MSLKIWLKQNKSVILFLLLLLYLYFRGTSDHGLIDPIEGLNASISLHMSATGNYFEPHLGSSLTAGKSLGFWWLSSFALKIFGWEEFALRFWSAIAGLLMILISACSAYRFNNENKRKSWLGASICASMAICFTTSQIASPSALSALLTSLIMFGLLKTPQNKNWLILTHSAIVLSMILNGYDVIFYTLMSLLIFGVTQNDYELLKNFFTYPAGIIISIIGLGCYILLLMQTNPLILHFMRCQDLTLPSKKYFLMPLVIIISFMPYVGFIIRAVYEILQDSKKYILFETQDSQEIQYEYEKQILNEQEIFEKKIFQSRFFMMIWGLVFLVFSLLTCNYFLLASCVVPFSGILGDLIDEWLKNKHLYSIRMSVAINMPLILITIILIIPVLLITVPALEKSVMSLIPYSGFLILFWLASWYYARTKQILKWSRNVIAVGLLSLMPLAGVFDLAAEATSIQKQGLALRDLIQKDDTIIQYYENHPSIYFYTFRDSQLINAPLLDGVQQKKFVTDVKMLHALWRGKSRVFLLIPSEQPLQDILPSNVFNIVESDKMLLLSNQ